MKNFLKENKPIASFVLALMAIWRIFLYIPELISKYFPTHPGYLGPIPWSNMDGIHYLGIAQRNYVTYEQAFFPLYPILISFLGKTLNNFVFSGLLVSYISLFFALFFLYKLMLLDVGKKDAKWVIIFLLFFFTSFFLASIYTESLFLAFLFSSIYFVRKRNFLLAAVLAGFASGTRLVGIFILPLLLIEFYENRKLFLNLKSRISNILLILLLSSSGLIAYIYHQWKIYGDALMFIHSQPAFGAGRTGGQIILLPQVVYRYFKIFLTIPFYSHDFLIAMLEFLTFFLFLGLLIVFWRKIRLSYLVFSLLAIIVPTFTGTFSSEPRYVLSAFPVFVILGTLKNDRIKILILFLFLVLLIILTTYFLKGFFIA